MPAAPNINNYYIGKGKVYWTPEGGRRRGAMAGRLPIDI